MAKWVHGLKRILGLHRRRRRRRQRVEQSGLSDNVPNEKAKDRLKKKNDSNCDKDDNVHVRNSNVSLPTEAGSLSDSSSSLTSQQSAGSDQLQSSASSSLSTGTNKPSADADLAYERKQYRIRKWRDDIYDDANTIFTPLLQKPDITAKKRRELLRQRHKFVHHNMVSIRSKIDADMSEQTLQWVYRTYVGRYRAKIDPRAEFTVSAKQPQQQPNEQQQQQHDVQ